MKLHVKDNPGRLDRFLAQALPSHSRRALAESIRQGKVRVNGFLSKPSFLLRAGDVVDVILPRACEIEAKPVPIDLTLLHQDDQVLVIEKPAGLLCHPTAHESRLTVVGALLARFGALPSLSGPEEAGLVHRLDREVSGVLVCGRTIDALKALDTQFRNRTVTKVYGALVQGTPSAATIDKPLRPARREWKVRVAKDGKPALTELRVLKSAGGRSLVEVRPQTGRSHQIRVHLASIGCPIFGDTLYGGPSFPRLALHAWKLEFDHPKTGKRIKIVSKLPKELSL